MLTQNLSPQQIEAVNAIDEDVEIIACAGAGKTGVVTRRIVNILKNKPDVAPEKGLRTKSWTLKFVVSRLFCPQK